MGWWASLSKYGKGSVVEGNRERKRVFSQYYVCFNFGTSNENFDVKVGLEENTGLYSFINQTYRKFVFLNGSEMTQFKKRTHLFSALIW